MPFYGAIVGPPNNNNYNVKSDKKHYFYGIAPYMKFNPIDDRVGYGTVPVPPGQ